MAIVKQGSIKYHFLSLWYDLTWDLTMKYSYDKFKYTENI